jgi:hypothetical protein
MPLSLTSMVGDWVRLLRRERAASTLLHPARARTTATLCQGPVDPEALALREEARRERDAALDASIADAEADARE